MFYQSPGALHMHTFHSDGTGSVQDQLTRRGLTVARVWQ